MKLNPVYKKELKIGVRTVKMSVILLFYNLLLAVIGLFAFYLSFEQAIGSYGIDYTNMLGIYTALAVIEICLVLFIVPGFTANAIAGERERQTLEILLTTRLTPFDIIIGKLASSISSILFLVFSSLPVLAISFAVGGVDFLDLMQLMFLAVVTAIFIGSIGIFFSTVFKKTTAATVFTYGAVILLVLGTAAIAYGIYLIVSLNVQNSYAAGSPYTAPDIKNAVLIFLVNPIVTLVSMITNQFGNPKEFEDFLGNVGKGSDFIMKHWFGLSVSVQLAISVVLIWCSTRLLDPLRPKSRRKRK